MITWLAGRDWADSGRHSQATVASHVEGHSLLASIIAHTHSHRTAMGQVTRLTSETESRQEGAAPTGSRW